VRRIDAHAREAAAIVADLVVSARADTPITVLPRALDAGLLCEEVVGGLAEPDAVAVDIGTIDLWADTGLTKRIVSSLLSNALHYGGASVELKTTSSGPDIIIQVIDSGPAIPKRERERMFQSDLHSGQPVTSPAVVGLSLTVARHLANQMDGDITYRRTGDGHNVFELRLPSERYAPIDLDLVPV
jgi:signal transduction histidine kinase